MSKETKKIIEETMGIKTVNCCRVCQHYRSKNVYPRENGSCNTLKVRTSAYYQNKTALEVYPYNICSLFKLKTTKPLSWYSLNSGLKKEKKDKIQMAIFAQMDPRDIVRQKYKDDEGSKGKLLKQRDKLEKLLAQVDEILTDETLEV